MCRRASPDWSRNQSKYVVIGNEPLRNTAWGVEKKGMTWLRNIMNQLMNCRPTLETSTGRCPA